ncbi:hypothetical protein HYG89_11645 [Acinetobacter sp. SwsAc5]|uniref:hypothetical protein n=1 Tax=Acinetobacter sp. SwsAc5 TaxID=2749438 RepID=UPI0015BA61CB|nr:hypothetical protein [Acinetobacter sp. SwsAc5]NWK53186.1 hypothetical protein [Acinetobacter sp. SwsAc5]
MSYKVVLLSEVDIQKFISGYHHDIPVNKRNIFNSRDEAEYARTLQGLHTMKMLKIHSNGRYTIIA